MLARLASPSCALTAVIPCLSVAARTALTGQLASSVRDSSLRWFTVDVGAGTSTSDETIQVTFVDADGVERVVQAPIGKSLLEVAHDNDIDLEGACEGSLACSTCHLIFESEDYYKRVPEASEDEMDMLDLAFGLTDTSRLGCQVITAKELDGVRVKLPAATRNFYVDGHKPKPH